jgi:hypothetical protein
VERAVWDGWELGLLRACAGGVTVFEVGGGVNAATAPGLGAGSLRLPPGSAAVAEAAADGDDRHRPDGIRTFVTEWQLGATRDSG